MSREPVRRATPFVSRARLFSYLVTRQTGRAVRLGIQRDIDGRNGQTLTLLDFRDVSVIDFSCADEVVAKLVRTSLQQCEGCGERFFLFAGMREHHMDPVESALVRRSLTVAAERAGGHPCLLGHSDPEIRRAWKLVAERCPLSPHALAPELGVSAVRAAAVLDRLHRRRLVVHRDGEYLSLRRAISDAAPAASER